MGNPKFKIKNNEINDAISSADKTARKALGQGFEIKSKIGRHDMATLSEGKRYIDVKNNRVVYRIGNKLFAQGLTEITE